MQLLTIPIVLAVICRGHALTSSELADFSNGATADQSDATNYVIQATGLPDHNTQVVNPNTARDKNYRLQVPKIPTFATRPYCLPMGIIGITRNGVAMYNPLTVEGYNAVEGEHAETFDSCDGHADNRGTYHYHQLMDCVYNNTVDEFIGIALDGYPIYGPKTTGNVELTSEDLDGCHGHTQGGQYRYRATRQLPYLIGCYRGTIVSQTGVNAASNECDIVGKNGTNLCSCNGATKVAFGISTLIGFLFTLMLVVKF